jgi:hypothetical protein
MTWAGLSGDEWSWTIQTSQIHLALFSRPGIYAGAMNLPGFNNPRPLRMILMPDQRQVHRWYPPDMHQVCVSLIIIGDMRVAMRVDRQG